MATAKIVVLSASSRRISKRPICRNVAPVASPVRLRFRGAQAAPVAAWLRHASPTREAACRVACRHKARLRPRASARQPCSLASEGWCGRPDLNRHSSFEPRDFLTSYGFGRLALALSRCRFVCGLDYTFTLACSCFRCCSSSLYTFAPVVRPARLARDCLLPVSPTLGSSAPSVSRRALKLLNSLAS